MALLEQGSISAYTESSMGNTLFFLFSDFFFFFFFFFSTGHMAFHVSQDDGDIYDQIAYHLGIFPFFFLELYKSQISTHNPKT